MKTWTKDIEINAPIEKVWLLLDGGLENMQKIMPQVIENKPIKVTENVVGSVYRQKYKERNRIEEYDVTTLEYEITLNEKVVKIGFTLAKMFEITACYRLKRLDDNKTFFSYTITNRPLKWYVKIWMFFATDKVVITFLERVKKESEKQDI